MSHVRSHRKVVQRWTLDSDDRVEEPTAFDPLTASATGIELDTAWPEKLVQPPSILDPALFALVGTPI